MSCWSVGKESLAALALLGLRLFSFAATFIVVERVVFITSVEKIRRVVVNVVGSECRGPFHFNYLQN